MYASWTTSLATGCLALPLYTLIGTNRWQNKQELPIVTSGSRPHQRRYGTASPWCTLLIHAWLYYIIGDDTNRKYPIDVLVRQTAWPFGVHFLSVAVVSLIAFAVMITIAVFRQPRNSRK